MRRAFFACLIAAAAIISRQSTAVAQAAHSRACRSVADASTADDFAGVFAKHQFVFVASTHGDSGIDEILSCVLTRASFHQTVTDIVVEWASAAHQRMIDRCVVSL